MKLKKKEEQSVGALVLLRRGNKILMGAKMEMKCGAETEGKTIQRLPHLGNDTIYKQQKETPRTRRSPGKVGSNIYTVAISDN